MGITSLPHGLWAVLGASQAGPVDRAGAVSRGPRGDHPPETTGNGLAELTARTAGPFPLRPVSFIRLFCSEFTKLSLPLPSISTAPLWSRTQQDGYMTF